MDYSKLSMVEFLDLITDLDATEKPLLPIEVYKYLKHHTENFKENKVLEVVEDIEGYINTSLFTRVWGKFIEEGIELPIYINLGDDLALETGDTLTQFGLTEMDTNLHYLMRILSDELKKINGRKGDHTYKLSIPGLPFDLTHDQRVLLFEKLRGTGLISKRTHKESFLAAFGEPIELENYYPIEWTGSSKQSFRELVEEFIGLVTNKMIGNILLLFTYKKKPLRLNKADKNNSASAWEIHQIAEQVKAYK